MLGAPPAFVLSQDQTLYKWYLSLKSVKSCSLSTQSLASCVNYFWNCFKCFSKHIKVPYKFFDIVQFSRSCSASALRLTTCLFYHRSGFLSSPFFEAFELSELESSWSFSALTGLSWRSLVLFKGFVLNLKKSFFSLSAWRSSIIPHPGALVNTFWQIFSFFFAHDRKRHLTVRYMRRSCFGAAWHKCPFSLLI